MGKMLDKIENREVFMKRYEKPEINSLALSSLEDVSAFQDFENFDALTTSPIYSYLQTSAKTFKKV